MTRPLTGTSADRIHKPRRRSRSDKRIQAVPGLRRPDTSWMSQAACPRHYALPWTENPKFVHRLLVEAMQRVCAHCPVQSECLEYALRARVTAGWWAGHNMNRFDYHHPPTAAALGLDTTADGAGDQGGQAA